MAGSVSTKRGQEADFRLNCSANQSRLAATSVETRSRPGAAIQCGLLTDRFRLIAATIWVTFQ